MWPPHPLQIATYLIFVYDILTFYIVLIPAVASGTADGAVPVSAILGIFYGALGLYVTYYGYVTTLIDPTDPTVYLEREAQVKGYNVVDFDMNKYEFYCNVCKTHVLENTKHCQACNRCVAGFDHHCPWLNNCVGRANYSPFIKMLSAVTIEIAIQHAICLLALHYTDNFRPLGESSNQRLWIMVIVNISINAPVFLLLVKLLGFHVYLWFLGITTY